MPETVEAILQCHVNFNIKGTEMYEYIIKDKKMLNDAKSKRKYN